MKNLKKLHPSNQAPTNLDATSGGQCGAMWVGPPRWAHVCATRICVPTHRGRPPHSPHYSGNGASYGP